MAKIGLLVLDRGRWRGEQIVSEAWIEESTAPGAAAGEQGQQYGYLWGLTDAPFGTGRARVIVASGWGSQFIHISPDLDAVVVTTGGNHMNGKTFAVGGVLVRYLLPGIEQ